MTGVCQYTEGCRFLDGPVGLKPGETRCLRCAGFGGLPIQFDPHHSQFNPARCNWCNGTGKGPP